MATTEAIPTSKLQVGRIDGKAMTLVSCSARSASGSTAAVSALLANALDRAASRKVVRLRSSVAVDSLSAEDGPANAAGFGSTVVAMDVTGSAISRAMTASDIGRGVRNER